MTDQEKQSLKEAKRAEERAAEEIRQSARDQARREANLAREQAMAERISVFDLEGTSACTVVA